MRLTAIVLQLLAFTLTTHAAPPSQRFNRPHFGGPVSDWLHAFGKPVVADPSGYDWMPEKCASFTLHRLQVLVLNHRVSHLTKLWCKTDKIPSVATRQAEAVTFFPGHSVNKGKVSTAVGVLTIYFSKDIAPYFGDNVVQDCNGNPVKHGTFNMSAGGNGWTIDMGTCQ
jgi:hypothetical protein